MNSFGGNIYMSDIEMIMKKNAVRYNMNYSKTKENRWNLWIPNSGITLSFVLNKGLFIPSISGVVKKTLIKFYSDSIYDLDLRVKEAIKIYYTDLRQIVADRETLKEVEEYNKQKDSIIEEHKKEHEEFLTDEDYDYIEEIVEVKKTKKKVYKKKRNEIPGQLSFFDNNK